jgi:hypothetical protein
VKKNEELIAEDLQRIFCDDGVEASALFTAADNNGAAVTREKTAVGG